VKNKKNKEGRFIIRSYEKKIENRFYFQIIEISQKYARLAMHDGA
jgi:hypothetical protein